MMVDLRRLGELQHVLGTDASNILQGLLDSMRGAIDRIEHALAGGDLGEVANAAHVCRNDGLMVGAHELLAVLQTVEQAARAGELAVARAALAPLREVWPGTRDALERALRS
ncbi:MAG: Hpt domain-containing protein [Solirubrobacteraceae bacterium]|jgi:HPt (histidine-containing phosphotransfer) domain-containing protein